MKSFKNSGIYPVILLISILVSCSFPKTVDTKEETINALIGKWQHEDLTKSDVKAIEFTCKKNIHGDSLLVMEYQKKDSNGKVFVDGIWHYKGVGKIVIGDFTKDYTLHFSFVNNKTMELEYEDMYLKNK